MNDEELLNKYNTLIKASNRKNELLDEKLIAISNNNAIALMYIKENITDLKKMVSNRFYLERAGYILDHIKGSIGEVDEIFVYRQLRKKGLLDGFDCFAVALILSVFLITMPIYITSDELTIFDMSPVLLVSIIILLIAKLFRHMIRW